MSAFIEEVRLAWLTINRYIKLQEEYIKDEQRYVDLDTCMERVGVTDVT